MKRWAQATMVSLKDGEKMELKSGEELVFDCYDATTRLIWFVLLKVWEA
jgi:hypothetical protein